MAVTVPRGSSEVEIGRVKSLKMLRDSSVSDLTKLNKLSRARSSHKIKKRDEIKTAKKLGRRIFSQMRNEYKGKVTWDNFFESNTDRVTITVDQNTAQIPWELAYDGKDFLCTRFRVTRRLSILTNWIGGQTPKEMGIKKALVVGLNYAEGRDGLKELDFPEAEAHDIASRLDNLGYILVSGGPVTGKKATLNKVTQLLKNNGPLAAFHFTGHGSGSSLSLFDRELTAQRLKKCFSSTGAPFLTFLNACSTNQFDRTGLVKIVAENGGDQIIASFWSIFDDASTKFADLFYDLIKQGISIPDAVYEARLKLKTLRSYQHTWPAFVVYGGELPLKYNQK